MRGAYAAMLLGPAFAALVVGLSTSSVSGSSDGSSATTGAVTAIVAGGSGTVSHSWARVSGSAAISANWPSSATTNFTGIGLSPGGSLSATFRDTISDPFTGEIQNTLTVTVYVERSQPALSGGSSGSCVGVVTASTPTAVYTSYITIVPSGGVSPFEITFAKTGPPGDTSSVEPSGATARFANTLGPGQSASPTARATIRDAIGQVAYVDFGGSLSNNGSPVPPLSASAGSVDGYANGPYVIAGPSTGSPSGGTGSYVSHAWTKLSGEGSIDSPSLQSTTFNAYAPYGGFVTGTFRYTVTDSAGNTASATITVSFSNYGLPPGGFS